MAYTPFTFPIFLNYNNFDIYAKKQQLAEKYPLIFLYLGVIWNLGLLIQCFSISRTFKISALQLLELPKGSFGKVLGQKCNWQCSLWKQKGQFTYYGFGEEVIVSFTHIAVIRHTNQATCISHHMSSSLDISTSASLSHSVNYIDVI